MAIETNIFKSNAASAAYVNPTLWSNAIEQFAREKNVLAPLGVTDTRALGTAGVQINIAKNIQFAAAELTEGTKTPVSTMAFAQVTVTFFEVGLAKQISIAELDYGLNGVFNDVTMNMGEALGTYKDIKISTVLTAGAGSTLYPGTSDEDDIAATDVFTTGAIANGKTRLRVDSRNASSLIIHPNCENALIKDSQFIDASKYGSGRVVSSGEIGTYLGIRVISSNHVTTSAEGASDAITVYNNILLGERPFVIAAKRSPRVIWAEDSVLDRAITFAADEHYGVSVLNSDSVVILKAAGTTTFT